VLLPRPIPSAESSAPPVTPTPRPSPTSALAWTNSFSPPSGSSQRRCVGAPRTR
jgi:hypothetical protein